VKATIPPLSSYPTLPAQFYIHCRSFPTLLRTHECAPSHFSHVRLFVTPWTVAGQAPVSMGFSRQEHWGELPCPPPGGLPDLGTEPASLASPALAGRFFTASATWEATVRTGHGTTDWCQIGKGVHQGCILSPCFFNLYAEYIMRTAGLEETQAGIKMPGEISITSDMQMTPPLWQKVKRN